jgi:4-diphosphocytidyl-2-C-methyl-D-erythritol kinase
MTTHIVEAPAKINLTLAVVGKRDDGYHRLVSVMAALDLADRLTVTAVDGGDVSLTCDDPSLPVDESNLVVRAAMALRRATGVAKGARIHLEKRIPVAAGLGGGSSDAAAALIGLGAAWGVELSPRELTSLAVGLGADVPFFLGTPLALVEGIGERLTAIPPVEPFHLLLVKPTFGVAAADAYRGASFSFAPRPVDPAFVDAFASGDPALAAAFMRNDLEPWVLATHPALAAMKRRLIATDPAPTATLMSGSGSTLFALYRSAEEARRGADTWRGEEGAFVAVAETRT